MTVNKTIHILGAGVTGLAIGKMFAESGWKVTIYEAQNVVGGLAATAKWDEFDVDFGPHIFHTVNKNLEEYWEREFGDLFIKSDFWGKNVKGAKFDEYHDYPLSYEAINEYPPKLRDKILSELKDANGAQRSCATNYREYVRALVGSTLQQMFFEDYPRKLWGISTEEMASNWAPKRIEIRQERKPFYTARWNAVGKFGSGCIMERMAETITRHGGKILLGCEVREMLQEGDALIGFRLSTGEEVRLKPRELVISTIPISVTADLLRISHGLKFRGVVAVTLAFQKAHILPEGLHFLYYDSPEVIFHRVSEQKRFSSAGFPDDKTFLTAEIAFSEGDSVDQTTFEMLVQRVLDDAVKVGLVQRKDFLKGMAVKRPHVYPLLVKNYEHQVREVQSKLARLESLYCVGGPAEYNYADIHINFLKAMDLFGMLMDKHSDFYNVKRATVTFRPKPAVALNGKLVGQGNKPFVIAEAGLNHNGSLELALQLVEEAKRAGCDAVKFQTFSAADRVSNKMKKAKYAEQIIGMEENLYELLSRLELSHADHEKIFAHGKKCGIDVFSTPFGLADVEFLESLNTPYYKVASSDLNNVVLLSRIAKTGKPLIVSTGMSTLGEIEESVRTILACGNDKIILLHCLSSYPADPEEMNLNVIKTLKKNFRLPVGFSDHAPGVVVSTAALAIGAELIERHFTLNKSMEGPDHVFSSEPAEMAELTKFSAIVNVMLGDGAKIIQPSEFDTINSFKKTIYARVNIKRGEIVKETDLTIKGPGGGLAPKYWNIVIGRRATRDIESDHPITWDDI